MKPTLITGLQWGDEGKGKVIDLLADKFDVTIRFNGGNNAGHTVKVGDTTLHFKLMPSAALHGKKVLIAQAVVINPKVMLQEIDQIKQLGVKLDLGIDPRCHVVLPYHQALDGASEASKGKAKTGSLGLGIGFSFEDRTNRAGIRMEELVQPTVLREKLKANWDLKKRRVVNAYQQQFPLQFEKVYQEYVAYGRKLKPYLLSVAEYTLDHLPKKRFLLETAQGFSLDFVFGTYPYTVAYHTLASSALPDIGLPPMALNVVGIVKAYTTRVGNGPFPTELKTKIGDYLQEKGHEFGTVSGRRRRCGWLDLPILQHAGRLSGINSIILTKLDVLSGLKTLKIKTAKGYVNFPGWQEDISTVKRWDKLPVNCRRYVLYLEKQLYVPIKYVSVGPDRRQTISRK
ncbi:MAG: Adenylosuccinate synthetase [Candidatus Pacebacteria bacterium GW2011_GWA1_46_10]|nr:MAG: Adenylosuccinate synthetase [Candidatus Pacebacteria bacterium GW2011_GWA1_46_10]HCR81296.1 adenylosuccinate synthetase [Candidatus Paceibacterota bacterium]